MSIISIIDLVPINDAQMKELSAQEIENVNGGFGPLVYFGAVLIGAGIGAAYSAYQGYKAARCSNSGQMCDP